MASKLIRDDMLDSERVHNCSVEARWLFVTILLLADDVGLIELNPFKLGRRSGFDPKTLKSALEELASQDLIRPYEAAAKRYCFVPKYRQRLRLKRAKCPMPPAALMADDLDASNKIKGLAERVLTGAAHIAAGSRAQPPEPEPEPEPKKKRHTSIGKQSTYPPAPTQSIVDTYHEVLPDLPAVRLMPDKRKASIAKFWRFVFESKKSDDTPRATNAEEALAWIRVYFERASLNDFLMGRGKRSGEHAGWKCDLDFLLSDRGKAHVIEKTESE